MTSFGVIESSVFRSKRFRPLSPMAKLVYLSCHISPHRNELGLFTMPLVYLADDLKLGVDQVEGPFQEVIDSGLIDYDYDDDLIRIRNWERRNAPRGPQESIGRITKSFDKSPKHVFTVAAFINFAHDILNKAAGTDRGGAGWNGTEFEIRMTKMIFQRLEAYATADLELFSRGFIMSGVSPSEPVLERLWEQLSQSLIDTLSDTLSIPTRYIDHNHYQNQRSESEIKDQNQRSEIRDQGEKSKSGATDRLDAPRKSASAGPSSAVRRTQKAGAVKEAEEFLRSGKEKLDRGK